VQQDIQQAVGAWQKNRRTCLNRQRLGCLKLAFQSMLVDGHQKMMCFIDDQQLGAATAQIFFHRPTKAIRNRVFKSLTKAQPAENWHIRVSELSQPWQIALGARLKYWFFEEEYSPKLNDWNQQALVDLALNYLIHEIGEANVFEVLVSPTMWYDCQWQDFVLTSNKGRWMLHLGFSD